ncbi:MAG: hypothetical protein COB30_012580 [Ectothiorhodospiraceae bacterium]|nr:hypothetical protein [Ectothiorhodospiraceae bacterium]
MSTSEISKGSAINFEPLRHMESFTKDMFNRIIDFQERKHHAWNTNLSFEARIKGLPLHNLIFSNPDRDPATHSATVAPYFPLREEMQKFAFYIRQLGDSPVVCDLFPGNGFIGSLLGGELGGDVNDSTVLGLENFAEESSPNQIESFLDAEHFSYSSEALAKLNCDAALVSWPLSGSNPSTELTLRQTKIIIYIFTQHADEKTQQRQTGSDEMITTLGEHYRLIDSWDVVRPKDILHDVWPDMTPSIAETRHVHIYAHNSVGDLQPAQGLPPVQCYDWEKDLQMALLALQAKSDVEGRGFPT